MFNSSELISKYGYEFNITFHIALKNFMHPVFGFDVIKFDEHIKPDDENGESCADAIKKRYDDRAVELVRLLISDGRVSGNKDKSVSNTEPIAEQPHDARRT